MATTRSWCSLKASACPTAAVAATARCHHNMVHTFSRLIVFSLVLLLCIYSTPTPVQARIQLTAKVVAESDSDTATAASSSLSPTLAQRKQLTPISKLEEHVLHLLHLNRFQTAKVKRQMASVIGAARLSTHLVQQEQQQGLAQVHDQHGGTNSLNMVGGAPRGTQSKSDTPGYIKGPADIIIREPGYKELEEFQPDQSQEFPLTEGFRPPEGWFDQSPECEKYMRTWLNDCAFPEDPENMYHTGMAKIYEPGTEVADNGMLSTASYIGNLMKAAAPLLDDHRANVAGHPAAGEGTANPVA
jgi:hypothetical protein